MDSIDKINAVLTAKGLSGTRMAREMGMSTGTYSLWNTRKSKPYKSTLLKVAEYLGVPYASLLPDDSEELPPELLGEKEKAAPSVRSGYEASVIEVMQRLTEAERQQALGFMYGLAARHGISDKGNGEGEDKP